MLRFLVTRLASSVVVFLIIAIGLFILVRLAPGDPADALVPIDANPGDREALVEQARVQLGLDKPIPVQFVLWFGGLVTGNLGYSYQTSQPVAQMLADRLGPTLLLSGTALLVGLIIAIPVGIVIAVRRNGISDTAVSSVSVVALAIPTFFSAMLGIWIFAVQLHVLPSAGMNTPGNGSPSDVFRHLILPVGILALAVAASFIRYIRGGMLEQLGQDYIRTVMAKGSGTFRATMHAFRNSLIPLVTVLALYIPLYFAGAVVVETVFSWPGVGQLAINALVNRDYPVIIAFGLYVAVLVLVCNLLADVAYALVDPRVRSMQ
ncbi:MAG: transporter permease [Streptosporangiaceae bacterium]|nr:transporter permease [Streptosporangiaceae bacterium]